MWSYTQTLGSSLGSDRKDDIINTIAYPLDYPLPSDQLMYWRAKGVGILIHLDDLRFLIFGYEVCLELARIGEEDMRLGDLTIN